MIKYAEINGYYNRGELGMFNHIYQFVESDKVNPMIILVHAYECDTKVFKGYLFNEHYACYTVDLTDEEIKIIEEYCGKLTQVNFNEFKKGTALEEYGQFDGDAKELTLDELNKLKG